MMVHVFLTVTLILICDTTSEILITTMIRNLTTKLNQFNNLKTQSQWRHHFAKLFSSSSYFEEIEYPEYLPEPGVIQTSLYGDDLVIPKCTIDEYVWSNVNNWSNKTAIVSNFHYFFNHRN